MATNDDEDISPADLQVPVQFANYDDLTEADMVIRLEEWKQKACHVLIGLSERVRLQQDGLDSSEHARVIYTVAAFYGDGPWVLAASREAAKGMFSLLKVDHRVLSEHIKPVFRANPHPSLNVETGRKLPQDAGGPMGFLDYLEGQVWKSYPAIANVISWCLLQTDQGAIDKLWHLFIPPIMTFLDDHVAKYKLQGVRLAAQLLDVAPPDLLRRTGIDILLRNSFKTALTFLHNPETPQLIRATVRAYLRLTALTTANGSEARFEHLSSLLGDSIMGNVWVHAARDPDSLQASVEVLPEIIGFLGIGTSRYLKGLIPQLVYTITPSAENGAQVIYKLSSLTALGAVMDACAPRIRRWKSVILDGLLRCWVELAEQGPKETGA
ncbi:uncharacterized protein BXZ73DRAFT_91788 [Epithele typhae]|uniref:uncharacterized protein n=1 Tax=Epithele typhae TaxID=378194 RepID=UPI002007CA15|nr:uncharacterized protein BXZ73DRAFT_91788 [Epithele typhae]KAH9921522.1 hypothetical protein BXZ73DRAFT_91788 [Epithele typhae]